MSSSESDENTKVYKLRSRAEFPVWKQKVISIASAKGFDQYLTTNLPVKTQAELDNKELDMISEVNDDARRILKGELTKWKRERKRSLAAADMLTSSVRSKDLKNTCEMQVEPVCCK